MRVTEESAYTRLAEGRMRIPKRCVLTAEV